MCGAHQRLRMARSQEHGLHDLWAVADGRCTSSTRQSYWQRCFVAQALLHVLLLFLLVGS